MADDDKKSKNNQDLINHFLVEHAPLINMHVKKLKQQGKIGSHIDDTDLHSAGFQGLMEALHRYDPNVGASLATYANRLIQGKMLDHVVESGAIPKSIQTKAKKLKALAQIQDKPPVDEPAVQSATAPVTTPSAGIAAPKSEAPQAVTSTTPTAPISPQTPKIPED